jgi:hypothetical protein
MWYRTSANSNTTIQETSVVDQTASFTYLDLTNTVQTLTFTFSLISSLQNSSVSEDIEHIRETAPSVYYTQDRMVNGRDYNSYMLQDPSILKLRAVNRTFAGDSKYIAWHDPQEYYENVKIFGEDLALYWIEEDPLEGGSSSVTTPLTSLEVLNNMIEPLLCSSDFYNVMIEEFAKVGRPISEIRCEFTVAESDTIVDALDDAAVSANPIVDLYYSAAAEEWTVDAHPTETSIFMIRVEAQFFTSLLSGWTVNWRNKRMNAQSETTKFRHNNTTSSIINFDTLNSNDDRITILTANSNGSGDQILTSTSNYNVLGQELVEQNLPNSGLPDDNRLSVITADVTNDGIPDNLTQDNLLKATETFTTYGSPAGLLSFSPAPNGNYYMYYMDGTAAESLIVTGDGVELIEGTDYVEYGSGDVKTQILLTGSPLPSTVVVEARQYVYFNRASSTDPWVPIVDNDTNKSNWLADQNSGAGLYKREYGRYPLNFAWFYNTPRNHLIDPAPSNIIDTFIITRSYYLGLLQWLEGKTSIEPTPPTPLDLRTAYSELLDARMISDSVILQTGEVKILFGSKAIPELRATFKVVRPTNTSLTDNEVKVKIVNAVREFFDINYWTFGETFFFTELAAAIHNNLENEINSVVLVPSYTTNQFGDLFQVQARENELFAPDITTSNIEIVDSYTAENIRQ